MSCDRNTIAAEVPVWYYDKRLGETVAGHIDLVQVNRGRLWLLDYKPHAARENPDKVMRQLGAYARALGYRAGIAPGEIRCGWFDEEGFFGFMPLS